MVDGLPVVDPHAMAHALTREWRAALEDPAPAPVTHAPESFLAYAPVIDWSPQPLIARGDVDRLLARCPASAPGPDGVQYLHLASLGSPVSSHLAELANLWLEHAVWMDEFRHSYLVPLPKTKAEEPWYPASTRPITLANTSGKILMRLLASSLYSCLSSVIVKTQHGFLPGHQIAECIIELESACLACAPAHPGGAAIFLDVRRVFDSLDLCYLFALLDRTAAPRWLVRALRSCYTGLTLTFLVQGVEGPRMHSRKGLRQGCPASAILFVLCMDPLLRWLEQMTHPSPTVIGYADDIALVLIDVRGEQGAGLSRFLVLQPLATAMHISFPKTLVLPLHRDGVGHSLEHLRLHLDDWRFASETRNALYLDVWVGHDAHGLRFKAVIDKMESRICKIESDRLDVIGNASGVWSCSYSGLVSGPSHLTAVCW